MGCYVIYELSINGANNLAVKKNYVRAEVLLSVYLIIPEGPHVSISFGQ